MPGDNSDGLQPNFVYSSGRSHLLRALLGNALEARPAAERGRLNAHADTQAVRPTESRTTVGTDRSRWGAGGLDGLAVS